MMIVSAKVSKRKFLAALLVAVGVIALLVFLCSQASASGGEELRDPREAATAGDNDARVAFLRAFGWEVAEEPVETQEVRIPSEFNDVFTRYNELQKSQGYDLEPYAGKAVKRYVYRIDNHPDGPDHFATLLICKNKIIGGDVTGTGAGGRIHSFQMPG